GALEGCRELRAAGRGLPPGGVLTRLVLRRPFLMAAVLMVLPHVLGSVVNVTYNSLRIVERLTGAQQAAFLRLVVVYNAIIYPFCLFLLFRQVVAVFRVCRRLGGGGDVG